MKSKCTCCDPTVRFFDPITRQQQLVRTQFLPVLIWIISRLIKDLTRASLKSTHFKNLFKIEIGVDFSLVSLPQVRKQ